MFRPWGEAGIGRNFTLASYPTDTDGGLAMYSTPFTVDGVYDYAVFIDRTLPANERGVLQYNWSGGSRTSLSGHDNASSGNIGGPIIANIGGVPTVIGVHSQDRHGSNRLGTPLQDYFYERVTGWTRDTTVIVDDLAPHRAARAAAAVRVAVAALEFIKN